MIEIAQNLSKQLPDIASPADHAQARSVLRYQARTQRYYSNLEKVGLLVEGNYPEINFVLTSNSQGKIQRINVNPEMVVVREGEHSYLATALKPSTRVLNNLLNELCPQH